MSRNRLHTDCECGLPFPKTGPAGRILTEDEYLRATGKDPATYRYRRNNGYGWHTPDDSVGEVHFAHHQCPVCGRQYALWCALTKEGGSTSGVWQVYDSSFWRSFNDEPAFEDQPTHPEAKGDALSLLAELQRLQAQVDADAPAVRLKVAHLAQEYRAISRDFRRGLPPDHADLVDFARHVLRKVGARAQAATPETGVTVHLKVKDPGPGKQLAAALGGSAETDWGHMPACSTMSGYDRIFRCDAPGQWSEDPAKVTCPACLRSMKICAKCGKNEAQGERSPEDTDPDTSWDPTLCEGCEQTCEKSEDGQHCRCWWDDPQAKCCRCGRGETARGEAGGACPSRDEGASGPIVVEPAPRPETVVEENGALPSDSEATVDALLVDLWKRLNPGMELQPQDPTMTRLGQLIGPVLAGHRQRIANLERERSEARRLEAQAWERLEGVTNLLELLAQGHQVTTPWPLSKPSDLAGPPEPQMVKLRLHVEPWTGPAALSPASTGASSPTGRAPFIPAPEAGSLLHESGLLFQINRLVLHPFGLALAINKAEDGRCTFAGLVDGRIGAGGMMFTPEDLAECEAKLRTFLEREGAARLIDRVTVCGYIRQPLGDPPDEDLALQLRTEAAEEERDELRALLGDVYAQRNELAAALATLLHSEVGTAWRDTDTGPGSEDGFRTVVFACLPLEVPHFEDPPSCFETTWLQVSWHLPDAEAHLVQHLPTREQIGAPAWDGHSTPEKRERLRRWLKSQHPARPATAPFSSNGPTTAYVGGMDPKKTNGSTP